jgi:ubiquitin-like modifier-activating enzyme ATG7
LSRLGTTSANGQVVEEYKKEGFKMMLRAFNDTDYLEKLTGLDELHKESEAIMDDVDWDEGSEGSF